MLVVDDEPMVAEVVAGYLRRDGHEVVVVADGDTAVTALERDGPWGLVVLDLMLPGVDGLRILGRIRAAGDLPVVVLSARREEPDRVRGLELGADDYLAKPFSPRELVARVRSVLRRSPGGLTDAQAVLRFPGLIIDPVGREVSVAGEVVDVPPRELDLLVHLARHPRRAFSRAELLEQVWNSSVEYQDPSTVTVHIRRLRRRLGEDPEDPVVLRTVWGVGYRFDPPAHGPGSGA